MNKCIVFWTSKCTKPAQGQNQHKFWTAKCTKPAQVQKKQKFWTSKFTKPAQGQKNNKKTKTLQSTWEGARWGKYPSNVFFPCAGLVHFEVQNFCFFVPVQVCCTLKFKTFVFVSLCRFGALWSLNLVFVLCLWRFGVTHGLLLKYILPHGIGIVCLKMMFFFHFFGGFLNQGFKEIEVYFVWEES